MYGLLVLIEAARQIQGVCGDRQQNNVNLTLAHGNGGVLSSQCTVILGSEDTLSGVFGKDLPSKIERATDKNSAVCGRVRGNRRDRRTDVFRRCGDDAEVLGRSGRRVGRQARVFAWNSNRVQCLYPGDKRAQERGRLFAVEHPEDEVQRGLGPIRGDCGQRFAGCGVVAAVEPQFPTTRQGIYKRPTSVAAAARANQRDGDLVRWLRRQP